MRDTSPEMEKKMIEMMQKKSPTERVKMGISMYETSRYLVTRAIKEQNPNISETALRQEIFLKFYRNDFDPATREKILKHLENVGIRALTE
ncbi:MAG: hypothetical protein K1000chlam2_00476 [Chlamydiae bacterium]|nr:hypothetical protein [Chlamydiota bacterium]